MITTLDPIALKALAAIATPDEVGLVVRYLNDISAGHYVPPYAAIYIADILSRLARSAPLPTEVSSEEARHD